MPSSFIRVLLFVHGIFLATILATPSHQIDVGVVVTTRTEAIRQGLISALSTTITTDENFDKILRDNVPSIKQDRNSLGSTEHKMPMPTLLELGQKFTLGTNGKRQFEFTAYGMQAFSKLAHLWNLPMQQLLASLRMGELHQISNPNGRLSNMDIFIKTADQQFFIKDVKTGMETLKNKQRKTLKKIRPRAEIDFFEKHFWTYFARMEEEFEMERQQSLLPKYFAFFGIKDNSYGVPGEERFFLLTKNLLQEKYKDEKNGVTNEQQQFVLDFTYKFDVKGSLDHQKLSAKKRNANKHPTFRYLDLYDESEQQMSADEREKLVETKEGCFFRNGIMLEDETYQKFIDILGRDALFLKETGKTDYSLLMGITFDKLNKNQMEVLKNENANVLVASCENCSANRGETYSTRIDKFIIIPGIIDALAQFNWRKIIDLVNRTVVKHDTEKKAKSAIDPTDYYYRFMCAVSTKVFRPQHNSAKQFEANAAKFCTWKITEPSL
ncbi:hypothetical protein niasHT_038614 [Heterodera trifolii]|uniref:PIPK domain-containing protein n=1 Tax=Heterodera trifolii TaxID=157864 RepID=A0ABD2I2J5_9BILA